MINFEIRESKKTVLVKLIKRQPLSWRAKAALPGRKPP